MFSSEAVLGEHLALPKAREPSCTGVRAAGGRGKPPGAVGNEQPGLLGGRRGGQRRAVGLLRVKVEHCVEVVLLVPRSHGMVAGGGSG